MTSAFTLRKQKKEDQMKPKANKRNKIIKIRAEINEVGNRKTMKNQ